MADPSSIGAIAMPAIGLGLSAFGSATQLQGSQLAAQGQREEGEANYHMNQYQAGVAEINSTVAKQNADYAWAAGESQALTFGMAAGQRQGSIRTTQAASGLDVNSGSNKEVQDSQKSVDAMSLATIRQNTAKTSYDYRVQSNQYDNQAELYRRAGTNALRAGEIHAQATILGGISSVSNRWAQNAMSFAPNMRSGSSSSRNPTVSYEPGRDFAIES